MQYIAIKNAILEQINQGVLTPRQKLPAERQLAETFRTTRITLREALALLEAEGTIYREDRRGWFIAPPRFRYVIQSLSDLSLQAEEQSRVLGYQQQIKKTELAHQEAAQLLHLPPFSELTIIEGLVSLENRPVACVSYWLNRNKLILADRGDASHPALSQVLPLALDEQSLPEGIVGLSDYHVTVCGLSGEIASRLRATAGSAGLLTERVLMDRASQPQLVERLFWRHDAVVLTESIDG